ncbi:hypothetical protein COU54_01635 [Candidatus Pacearchaeota archaeon CG10_big_fil_rev_8_21_14_0_10_31_24]|nr:MAG: hypothetical protein COU54_01635 [Candidatus Pacearchaeota archaeon CG10_big_fil_rev_8_21_14_0_10_31_24]
MDYNKLESRIEGWKHFLSKYYLSVASWFLVFGYFLIKLIIPFLRFNKLIAWDLSGLYFSIWYQKMYLFPKVIGWNPFFFLGYPQNQFYPPLFTYVTSALSYLMPLSWAFKLMFVLTLIAMPISFFCLARAYKFSWNKASVAMLAMTSTLFLFPSQHYGGNMESTFNIGLITHALGIALFFFYWASLEKNFDSKQIILPTLLFAAIVLTHIIASFAVSFLFISYVLVKVRNKSSLLYMFLHGLLATLLASFWIVPFIGKRSWLEAFPIGTGVQEIFFVVISVSYLALSVLTNKKKFMTLGMFMFILLAFTFIVAGFITIPLHLYRFMMYLYILIPLLILSLLDEKSEKSKMYEIALIIFLIISLFFMLPNWVDAQGPKSMNINSLEGYNVSDRIFIMAPYSQESSPHLIQHQVPMNENLYALRGLYIESARNSRYIFDIENQLAPRDSIVWGTYVDYLLISENRTFIENILPYQLELLGVNSVVASETYDPTWKKVAKIAEYERPYFHNNTNVSYFLYDTRDSNLIEVLDYKPTLMLQDWDLRTAAWFLSEDIKKGILVDESVPNYVGTGNENLEILEMSPRQDYIKFKVDSEKPVPILIKISQFANWKAYQIEDGVRKEIKIYGASPYLMLLYGHGEVEVVYESLFIDKLGIALSIMGIMGIILIFLRNYKIARFKYQNI